MVVALVLALVLLTVSVTLILRAAVGAETDDRVAARIREYGFVTGSPVADPSTSPQASLERLAERAGRFVAAHSRSIRVSALRQDLLRAGMHSTTPYRLLGYQAFSALLLPLVLA